jgi:hypothetical protein
MRFKPENIIGDFNYPGKKGELRAEKIEKDKLGANDQLSGSNWNSIKNAEGKSPLDEDNKYNSVEEEENFTPASTFKTDKDVVGQTEDDIINALDEKLAKEKASLAVIDSYGFTDVIGKLYESAVAKKDVKAIDDIIDRASLFTTKYQEILKRHLPEDEERAKVYSVFKVMVGEVGYIKDNTIKNNSERAELLSDMPIVKDSRPEAKRGQKIYYNDKGNSYLNKEEADRYKNKFKKSTIR